MKTLLISVCFIAGFVIADYTGSWEYSIDTPDATYDGALVLEKTDGVYTGKLKNDDGFSADLNDLKVEGDNISFNFEFQGFKIIIKGTFDGDELSAKVDAEGMQFPFTATRKS